MLTRLVVIALVGLVAACGEGGMSVSSTSWADHLGSPCDAIGEDLLVTHFGETAEGEYGRDPSDVGNPLADHVECTWRSDAGSLLARLTFLPDPERTRVSEDLDVCLQAGLECAEIELGNGGHVVTTEPLLETPWCPGGPGCRGGPTVTVALDGVAMRLYAPGIEQDEAVELAASIRDALP